MESVSEVLREHGDGLYTRAETINRLLFLLAETDTEEAWEQLPEWAQFGVESFVLRWDSASASVDLSRGAYSDSEHARAVSLLRAWLLSRSGSTG
jgi:hypothetical protein